MMHYVIILLTRLIYPYSKVSNKRWGDVYFFQDFFGQNHTSFSCKTSILKETDDLLDQYKPWLTLLIQKKHFKHIYPPSIQISELQLRPPGVIQTPLLLETLE